MSDKYRVRDPQGLYFITMTIVEWVSVFTRHNQNTAIVESLQFSQQNKGLEVFAWVLMPSHLHMVCRCNQKDGLSVWLRDFKKFTSKQIVSIIKTESESHEQWLTSLFGDACAHLKRNQQFKVWQNGSHCVELTYPDIIAQKIEYIHQNPVKAKLVNKPEDYAYSSARNYVGMEGLIDVSVFSLSRISNPRQ